MKTTTVAELQAAQRGDSDDSTFSLGALAQKMVSDREGDTSDWPDAGDPWVGLRLDVEPGAAFGLVQSQLRSWLDEHGHWALEDEIRRKADELIADAEQRRPVGTNGTYTVDAAGSVTGFEADAPKAEQTAQPELPGQPEPLLKVPDGSIFGDEDAFAEAGSLARRAQVLIKRHPEHFEHLAGYKLRVTYMWKREGGKSKGRVTFGKCSKPSGLLKHFSDADFVIWLAADHCRAASFDDRQLEALLFHEMLHTGVAETNENTGRGGGPITVPHELEVFRAEVEIYGLWAPDLKEVGPAFQQASLFDPSVEQGQNDGSGLDCAGCGSFVDPERGGQLCDSCKRVAAIDRDLGDAPAVTDEICEIAQSDNPADAPLVCSVCGKPVDEDEMSLEEVSEARQNPAVVLCEACGEDGVIEGDD